MFLTVGSVDRAVQSFFPILVTQRIFGSLV